MLQDQEIRVQDLRRLERNRGRGRSSTRGTYQPQLRAEMKLLSDLYKMAWMMEKVERDESNDPESDKGSQMFQQEMKTEMASSERIVRKMMEDGSRPPVAGPPKPKETPDARNPGSQAPSV